MVDNCFTRKWHQKWLNEKVELKKSVNCKDRKSLKCSKCEKDCHFVGIIFSLRKIN